MSAVTRTGGFPIGFRRGWGEWQAELSDVLAWAKSENFGVFDVNADGHESGTQVAAAGLKVGSADLLNWPGLINEDPKQRADAAAENVPYIKACAAAGVKNFFAVMLPADVAKPRKENFGYMVEGFSQLVSTLEATGTKIVIEGWPGPGALCCTPEGYRAFFKEVPSSSMGVNYDPSHLIRMGISPLRFLEEFMDRVYHVHAKDTEILDENLYTYGHEQEPTFAEPIACGSVGWRYTIPGHGSMSWYHAFRMLNEAGYDGCVCIELEDANFLGTAEAEQLGLTMARDFLVGC